MTCSLIDPKLDLSQILFQIISGWGVSVESNDYVERIEILKKVECLNKFVSFEPFDQAPVKDLNRILNGIDWVIVGGESGSNARPMEKEWVEDIYQVCSSKGIPFFFQQWGKFNRA